MNKIPCYCTVCENEYVGSFSFEYTGKGRMHKICPTCERLDRIYEGDAVSTDDIDWLCSDDGCEYNEIEDFINGQDY